MKQLIVQVRAAYGRDLVYPICEDAILLADLCGQKTFTQRSIDTLKKLGYTFGSKPRETEYTF